jgi:LmbE family N-acetylglucosaminyl deacetylase
MEHESFARILVISPYCDDSAFACGQLLAAHSGATVVTVFAGRPPTGGALPEWDQAASFAPGDDVMSMRRRKMAREATIRASPP